MTGAVYFRCLQCNSERIKVAGEIPYKENDIVTCSNCGATVSYGKLKRANVERITKGAKERGDPDPSGLH
jgi:transcription elongation factor Elf1